MAKDRNFITVPTRVKLCNFIVSVCDKDEHGYAVYKLNPATNLPWDDTLVLAEAKANIDPTINIGHVSRSRIEMVGHLKPKVPTAHASIPPETLAEIKTQITKLQHETTDLDAKLQNLATVPDTLVEILARLHHIEKQLNGQRSFTYNAYTQKEPAAPKARVLKG